ncbi:MAG: TonB-dependent receptor [Acidobacteriota bacterium]|nr:TonB-dependent receptor [Acidobacteriota bacterium]
MRTLRFCLISLSVLLLGSLTFAQVQNSQLTGIVTDPSDAAIPNAKVTVTNPGTNLSTQATTNQSGVFTVKELQPAVYKVEVKAPGFKAETNNRVTLNAGTIAHLDFKMQLGTAQEVVEVTGEAAAVNVEDSKLSTTVNATQIANLPLNGRNVYDLIQVAPGAVNVNGVDFENGHGTVVNGVRENFNGFMINGVNNKGLSGGNVTTPIEDTVQEFQQLSLNNSAQYGSSAGSINNLVTKSGTNAFHGSVWEYFRNDALDANQFFLNRTADPRKDPTNTLCAAGHSSKCYHPALRFNQFGGTIGGPIVKDKLFFFGAIQDDHFKSAAQPVPVTEEDPAFRQIVAQTFPNSVANLLYSKFPSPLPGTPALTMTDYVAGGFSGSGNTTFGGYLCPGNYAADPSGATHVPLLFAQLFGYNPGTDDAGCTTPLTSFGVGGAYNTPTLLARRQMNFIDNGIAVFPTQTQTLGNLFNGKEWSGRLDLDRSASNRFAFSYGWYRSTDNYGPLKPQGVRGFLNPSRNLFPNGQVSWVHTFSPSVLNEARAGYTQNNTSIGAVDPGVPQIGFDDGSLGFGSYAGYPQFFKEHIYQYSDMVSIGHGNHSVKVGVDVRRNIENSEFNVARPSYYFNDPLFFGIDQPYTMTGGVDPGICAPPCKSFNQSPVANLHSNVRHWRNIEFGAYVQDDWKVTRHLTLNLGLRYDLYQRHHEENGLATTFLKGPGNNVIDNITTGQGWLQQANTPSGSLSGCNTPSQIALAQLAGVCGPGGFAPSSSLGRGRHKDFGPRLGFAWDVFGDGKTSLRGGFGVSYEGTLYNPLSNSRWNLPYYSFNSATNFLGQDVSTVIYGPSTGGPSQCPNCSGAPTFTGPPQNIGQGVGAQANGNIVGWQGTTTGTTPANANLATLTGIIFPSGVSDPYVYNYYLSTQRELPGKLVVEADYVGTAGHKLFRSEDVNRIPGGKLPAGACVTDNLGRQLCSQFSATNGSGRLNPNYGRLRVWENVVNSNYNSLQLQAKKQVSRSVQFNANYAWSHSIDGGSGWHNGATAATGSAAGDGFTTDHTIPSLDRGNSLFDIRHRFVLNYVVQIPGPTHGFLGAIAGGWQYSGIWSFQTGAHWEPYRSGSSRLRTTSSGFSAGCTAADVTAGNCVNRGGDYNLDAVGNDRPNSSVSSYPTASHDQWADGFFLAKNPANIKFSAPCLGCVSNLGRNTFVGPGQWYADMTLGKVFKLTERFDLKFEGQAFNVFNRANFLLATIAGGANNKSNQSNFGQAGGTLNARNIQLGLKLSF